MMALRRVTTLLLFLTLSQMSLALPRRNSPIPVTFCCKDNEILTISNKRSFIFGETSSVKCSRARNDETSSPRSVLAVNPGVEGPQGQVEAILSKEGEPANFACPVQKYNIDTPSGGRVASSTRGVNVVLLHRTGKISRLPFLAKDCLHLSLWTLNSRVYSKDRSWR